MGTPEGEPLLQRARDLARDVDISGSRYIPDGYGAIHSALRGQRSAFGEQARRCFAEKMRSPVIHLPFAVASVVLAWQYGDHDLIELLTRRIPDHWRDLPAQHAKFALFDRVVGISERLPAPVSDDLGPIANSGLLVVDSLLRVLLDEDRDDEVLTLTEQLRDVWPATTLSGRLARAWVAYRRSDASLIPTLSSVIADADRWGLALYEAEAIELAAAHVAAVEPAAAVELLEAVAAARRSMGLRWRSGYHRVAVAGGQATARDLLDAESLAGARTRGAASTLPKAAASAIRHLADAS